MKTIHIELLDQSCRDFAARERQAGITVLELTADVLVAELEKSKIPIDERLDIISGFAQRQNLGSEQVLAAMLKSNAEAQLVQKFMDAKGLSAEQIVLSLLKANAEQQLVQKFMDAKGLSAEQIVLSLLKANAEQQLVQKFMDAKGLSVEQVLTAAAKQNVDVSAFAKAKNLSAEQQVAAMTKGGVDITKYVVEMAKLGVDVKGLMGAAKITGLQVITDLLKVNVELEIIQKFMTAVQISNEVVINEMLKAKIDAKEAQKFIDIVKTTQEAVINGMLQQNIDTQLFLDAFNISNQKAIEILNKQKIDVQPFLIKRIASKQMTHQDAICVLVQNNIDVQRLVVECKIQQDDVVCGILKAGKEMNDNKVEKQFVISGMLKAGVDIAEYVQKNNVGSIEIILGMLMAGKGELIVKFMKDKGLTAAQVVSQMCETGINCEDFTICMKQEIEQVVFQMCNEKLDVTKFIEQRKTKNLEVFSKMIIAKLSVDAFIEQQKIQIPEIMSGLLLAKLNSEQISEFAKAHKIQDDDVIFQMLNENKSIDDYVQKAPVSNVNLISGMCKAGKEITQIIVQKKMANLDMVCGMLKAKMDMKKIQLQVKLTNEEFMVALQKYEIEIYAKIEIAKEYLSKLDEKLELSDFIKMHDRIKMDLELETKIIILLLGKTEQKNFCDMLAMLDLDWSSKMKILSSVCKAQFPTPNEQELKEEERMLRSDGDLYEARIRQEHKLFMDRICTFNQQRIQQKDLLVLHKSNEMSYLYDKIQKLEGELAVKNDHIKLQKEKIDNFDQTKQAELQQLRQAHIQEIEEINKTFKEFRDRNLKNLETEQENVLKYQNETKQFLQKSQDEFAAKERQKQQEIDDLKQQLKECQDNAVKQQFKFDPQAAQDAQVKLLQKQLKKQQDYYEQEQQNAQQLHDNQMLLEKNASNTLKQTSNRQIRDLQNELDEQFEQNKVTIEQIHKENDELIKVKSTKITELEAQIQHLIQAQEQLQAQIQLLQEQVFKGENLEKIQEEKQESERVKLLKDDVQRLNAELKRTNEMFIERDVVIAHMFDGAKVEDKQ